MIFVNLPVADLAGEMAFYQALGFTNEARFTDESAACMVLSETNFVMLLSHAQWQPFTDRPISGKDSSEVMLAISYDSREEVDRLTVLAGANGGIADVNPSQDHGSMKNRSFADPEGHIWEAMWINPAVANGEAQFAEAGA